MVVLARQFSNSSPSALSRVLDAYHQLDLAQLPRYHPHHNYPKGARWLTASQRERLVAGYLAGATVYELGREFGIQRATVAKHLKRQGVGMRLQSPTAEQVDEMARLYQDGHSLAKVGQRLGFDPTTVHNHIRTRGVCTRDTHGR